MKNTGWKEKDDYTIQQIRDYLEKHQLDAFIPWKTAHIAYLMNFYDPIHAYIPWEEMMGLLVIPRKSDAFVVGEFNHLAGAPEFGVAPWWLDERHGVSRPGINTLPRLVELIKEKGLSKGRIGIEKKWLPVSVYEFLSQALPDIEFVSADILIPQIRFIKTTREQELLRKAAELGLQSMDAYMQAIRSGTSPADARVIRAQHALKQGGEWMGGIDSLAWTGATDDTAAWWDEDARTSFHASPLRNWKGLTGDLPFFVTHFEAKYQCYYADVAWHEFYDENPDRNLQLYFPSGIISFENACEDFEILRRAQREALELIKPGMTHLQAKKVIDDFCHSDSQVHEHITNYYIHGIGANFKTIGFLLLKFHFSRVKTILTRPMRLFLKNSAKILIFVC